MRVNETDVRFDAIYGVDFSGAKLAGRNIWVAKIEPRWSGPTIPSVRGGPKGRARFRLTELSSLQNLSGTAERDPALQHLVNLIRASDRALWAMDFPFSLPIEILPEGCGWPEQLAFLNGASGDAYAVGLECVARAKKLGGALHIRRTTDTEARTPFDCYHYRIIYH